MTADRIRARILVAIMAVAILAIAAGCSPTAAPSSSAGASATGSAGAGSLEPDLTPVPGGLPTPYLSIRVGPDTLDVEGFGAILGELPPSFPTLPGQEPADTGSGPTSGSFAVNTTPAAAARDLTAKLTALGWTADTGSALEDGTILLEATGPTAGCKAEVRFTPTNGTIFMSVLYGASCPAS